MKNEQIEIELEDLKNMVYVLTNILKKALPQETLRKVIKGNEKYIVVEKALDNLKNY